MMEVTITTLDDEGGTAETLQVPIEVAPDPANTLVRIFDSSEWMDYKRRHPNYDDYLSVTIEFGSIAITVTKMDDGQGKVTGTLHKER